jgi:hypothetical protein
MPFASTRIKGLSGVSDAVDPVFHVGQVVSVVLQKWLLN